MRKQEIQVAVHNETRKGDIITVINRHGLRIKWNSREFVIPRYFESDGASIPRFLWDSVSPQIHPKTLKAALAHDYIYRTQPEGWTRKQADDMFYDTCRADGLNWWRSQKAYWGVRLFGGHAWRTQGGVKDGNNS